MTQAEELILLGGASLKVSDLHVRQIQLNDLRSSDTGGIDKYHQLLSIISIGHEDILKCLRLEEKYSQLSEAERALFTSYYLLTEVPSLRQCLSEALSFFISEPLQWDGRRHVFCTDGNGGGSQGQISDDNYMAVRRAIMLSNCLSVDDVESQKFKGKRGRAIYERIMAGRAAAQKQKERSGTSDSLTLPSIVSAVAARHNSINLLNIWDLTIYQLYDQFAQLNKNFQVDVSSLKWAAWGTEQFDYSLWYKSTKDIK